MELVFRTEKGEELTYAEVDGNNRAVLHYAGDAAISAERAEQALKSAETLLAMTSGQAGFPAWAKAGAPLVVNNTETGPVFSDRVLNNGLGIRPALNFDFVNQGALDPRISFKRASKDWGYDENGALKEYAVDEPVLSGAPISGGPLGLKVWKDITNLFKWSENPSDPVWIKRELGNMPTKQVAGMRFSKVIPNAVETYHYIRQRVSGLGDRQVIQFCAMEGGTRFLRVTFRVGSNPVQAHYWLDLETLTEIKPVEVVRSTVTKSNGIIRVALVLINGSEETDVDFIPSLTTSAITHSGNGVDGVWLSGLMLEESEFPSPYVRTEGSQVTVASTEPAPSFLIPSYTDGFSVYVEADIDLRAITGSNGLGSIFSIYKTNPARIRLILNRLTGLLRISGQIYPADTNTRETTIVTLDRENKQRVKAVLSLKQDGDIKAIASGGEVVTFQHPLSVDLTGAKLYLGHFNAGSPESKLNNYMQSLRFFNRALSDAEMMELVR